MDKKLKLKESIYILKESEEVYSTICTSTRRIKRFRVDDLVKEIIKELRTPKKENSLFNKLKKKYPTEDISKCIESLEEVGILRKYGDSSFNEKYLKASQEICLL